MELNALRKFVAEYDAAQASLDEERENVEAVLGRGKAQGVHPGGFKSACKLRKLKPTKLAAWLRAFDETRAALALDDQLDLEDAIKAQTAADQEPARPRRGRGRPRRESPTTIN